MKTIGIIGSRSRCTIKDYALVRKMFNELYEEGDWICSGGCSSGADASAYRIHKADSIPYLEFPANWTRNGLGAGYIRNSFIAGNSDVLIACWDGESSGTADTIKKFVNINGKDKLYIV